MRLRPSNYAVATAWCLSLALALGGAVDLGAAVLCVGFDGHVDVEYILAGCCVSSASSQGQPTTVTMGSGTPACGACVDLEVGEPLSKREKNQNPTPDPGVTNDNPQTENSGGTSSRQTALVVRLDLHSDALASLSTIILLI